MAGEKIELPTLMIIREKESKGEVAEKLEQWRSILDPRGEIRRSTNVREPIPSGSQ